MESKSSLPCLQELMSGSYSDPDESIIHPHTLLFNIWFYIILPSVSMSVQVFHLKFCLHFSSFPCLTHLFPFNFHTVRFFKLNPNQNSVSSQVPNLVSTFHCICYSKEPVQVKPCITFCNMLGFFYSEVLLAPTPTPELGDYLVTIRDCLLNI